MLGKSDRHSAEFLAWESAGRGFHLWDFPVVPGPLFHPLPGHGVLVDESAADDGRKPTFLSKLVRKASERLAPPPIPPAEPEERAERRPRELSRSEFVELRVELPERLRLNPSACADFFGSTRACREPVAFEFVATSKRILCQFALHPDDKSLFVRQFAAFFPEVALVPVSGFLEEMWGDRGQIEAQAVEFGLGKEFVIPFAFPHGDPFVGLAGALNGLEEGETAVFQVLFSAASPLWSESITRSVTHADGSAYFVNAPELAQGARAKVEHPLYAVVVRLAAKTGEVDRTWEILCDAATALGAYGSARGNELIPLLNDGYPSDVHEEDLLLRQTRRSGMLLNAHELAGFVHLPSEEVRASKLRLRQRKTKAAPGIALNVGGLVLGTNVHHGVENTVALTHEQRARHIHAIGVSGTGKSSILFNLIMQDIERGEGVSVLDPHGDLIDRILGAIPEHRANDVVLLDPSDEEYVVGFNILSAHSDWEKNLLASDLVSVFRRLSSAWGDQLNSVLHNAILAFLKSEKGGTLLDLRRFLLEPAFRAEALKSVRDSNVVYYWQKVFPQLTGNKSVGSVVTRLDTFLSPEAIRLMVAQRENRLDFGDIMNGGRIFLAKLSQGAIGKENSHLLGSLIVAKLQSEAMARQRLKETERRYHWGYIDEFHDFLTPSIADSLTGVRKYRLGFVLSHQELRQIEREPDVASALLSNAYTRIVFRVGDKDARTLEGGFSAFEARDIQTLGTGEAICRVERSDFDFNLTVPAPNPSDPNATERRDRVVELSRSRYAVPRSQLEAMLAVPETKPEPPPKAEVPPPAPSVPSPIPVATSAPVVVPPVEPKPLPELGRGGAEHVAIQERIKTAAEALGFLVNTEKEILGRTKKVDVSLSRDGLEIACEINVNSTIDWEVGNVLKCLKAGYAHVVAVSGDETKLRKLSAAVANSIGVEKARAVRFLSPDDLIAWLKTLPLTQTSDAAPQAPKKTYGGRTVRTSVVSLSPAEAKQKEEERLKLMADLMRQKRRP